MVVSGVRFSAVLLLMERDKITLEHEGHEIEIPELEAYVLLREFVEELVEDLEEEMQEDAEKATKIANIVEGNNLLNEREMTELVGENREHGGRVNGQRETGTFIWKKLNEFMEDL